MEGLTLTEEDLQMLTSYSEGTVSGDELRRMIYASVTLANRGKTTEAG